MIKKEIILQKLFTYGDLKYLKIGRRNKLSKHVFKLLLFVRKVCMLLGNNSKKIINNSSSGFVTARNKSLRAKTFYHKKLFFESLIGLDIFFISKTGKNIFISWLDVFGRLKLSKSLMTLNDPKKLITKKQKSFSIYFLLKKFGTTLRKRYRLRKIGLLIKGSLGIRRKKFFVSSLTHSGLKIKSIIDVTNIPFNGCRLKKKKRR